MLYVIKTHGYKDSDIFAKAILKRFKEERLPCMVVGVYESATKGERDERSSM